MDQILNSELRIGKFTSSQIHRLCKSLKSGKPTAAFYSYAEEVYYESLLGRSIKTKANTKPMKWGKLMEVVLYNILGMAYTMEHKSTVIHKDYNFWSGTPDLEVKGVKTGEIKCFEPLHFAKLSCALLTKNPERIKELEPEAYWQAVSNSILLGYDKTEIIAYMPYKSELIEIIEQVENSNFLEINNLEPSDYYFLTQDNLDSLPYLPDESDFSNVNKFEFVIPEQDKEHLINRVVNANEYINENLRTV
jgi:hypothetical protein